MTVKLSSGDETAAGCGIARRLARRRDFLRIGIADLDGALEVPRRRRAVSVEDCRSVVKKEMRGCRKSLGKVACEGEGLGF